MLFDSHVHLNDKQFNLDLDAVLVRARETGIEQVVDVGYSRSTIIRSRQIAEGTDRIYCAFGFHPHDAKDVLESDLDWLQEQLCFPKCKALGEIGLDLVKNYSAIDAQQRVFRLQLDLAKQVNMPVIFHSRGGEQEVLEAALSSGIEQAVLHCYTGSAQIAQKAVEHGYYISFAGFLTFGKGSFDWIANLPLDRILIETDCPYLAPVPFRGKRNEPAFAKYICRKLADLLKKDPDEVATVTSQNAKRFFDIG